VDASAFSPLRKIVSKRQQPDRKGVIITTETDDFGTKEQVEVCRVIAPPLPTTTTHPTLPTPTSVV